MSNPGFDRLSLRERDVLALLIEGRLNKEMARDLGVSIRVVRFHLTNLYRKLGARNRPHAAAIALSSGWRFRRGRMMPGGLTT
jgi:two-component system, NarL family, nitrate/nitrite response regulator NarL